MTPESKAWWKWRKAMIKAKTRYVVDSRFDDTLWCEDTA